MFRGGETIASSSLGIKCRLSKKTSNSADFGLATPRDDAAAASRRNRLASMPTRKPILRDISNSTYKSTLFLYAERIIDSRENSSIFRECK